MTPSPLELLWKLICLVAPPVPYYQTDNNNKYPAELDIVNKQDKYDKHKTKKMITIHIQLILLDLILPVCLTSSSPSRCKQWSSISGLLSPPTSPSSSSLCRWLICSSPDFEKTNRLCIGLIEFLKIILDPVFCSGVPWTLVDTTGSALWSRISGRGVWFRNWWLLIDGMYMIHNREKYIIRIS